MNASDYQKQAARTMIDQPGFEIPGHEIMVVWNALGLAGEAGEVAELVKKGVFHRHSIDLTKLEKEIGDVLWYAAALCTTLDLDLGEIMQTNIEKLKVRYPNGYSSADSQRRIDALQE
ncbi:MAG TPA: nucleoside triphosphate pyrophosphohydrolase family protein [Anaerolineales bacterium]